MVSVSKLAEDDTSSGAFEATLAGLEPDERQQVRDAHAFVAERYADRNLGTGEPALEHALGLAAILAGLKLDGEARAAGLLFATPEYLPEAQAVLAARFGDGVAALVNGVWKLNRLRVVTRGIASQEAGAEKGSQSEALRKMFLAMVEDIRAVLIRLASRTQTLRAIVKAPDQVRRAIASETLEIYAPLANRLGIWQLKWELEDYSFRFLEPELYKRVAGMLEERRTEREAFIGAAIGTLQREIEAVGVRAEVSGRPKHIYSIYSKMRGKGLDFSQLYDVRALRVLVDSVKDCYTALGVVHDLWRPVSNEFDDYIARPKGNFYQSLHTAVLATDGRPLEVQIRTHEMHRHAELGVAAHWRYKERGKTRRGKSGRSDASGEQIAILRQMLAWRDEVIDAADWVGETKRAAFDQTIYVLTPQGRVIDLPHGATPVDFAYSVHTDLGHRCRGAKVDGAMVPLNTKLANAQCVEIVAAKTGGPSRDWLNAELGYLASPRARNKVRQWFNAADQQQVVAAGRAAVERELQREGATGAKLETLAHDLGYAKTDEFFAAFGREEIGVQALREALRGPQTPAAPPDEVVTRRSRAGRAAEGVLIVGIDQLMTQLARCCKPAPPDKIVGFVTRGRGVSVHRRGCKSLAHLLAREPERAIETEWGARVDAIFAVDVVVHAHDRQGLLRDISEVFSRETINVTAVNTQSRHAAAVMHFTVEIGDVAHLGRALGQVAEVRGVTAVHRRE